MKIGDKIKYQGIEGKITSLFDDIVYIKRKYAREEEMVAISDIEEIPKEDKLSTKERGEILTRLVEKESIAENFKRDIIILNKLISNFPHLEFWREGFKPALKVNSLSYWYHRPEVEQLYKNWAIDLTKKRETVILSDTKVCEDIIVIRKPRNLLDILN